jgi:RsiW-degrading membrane proteinase PrsW (M82 family)
MNALLHIWNLAAAVAWYVLLNRRLKHIADKQQNGILGAFVVAGAFSVGLTLYFNWIYPPDLRYLLSGSRLLYHIGIVGTVEESAKFLAFLFAVKAGATIKEPQDGAIYGAVVGMTFGAIENVGYIQVFDGWFLSMRPIITTGGHAVYGAIWGSMFSQAVYANTMGRDPGATRNAVLGVALVAVIHGLYNASTPFLPVALLVDGAALLIAVALFRSLVELSPYRIYPLEQARAAVRSIRRGLAFNPKSPVLNRNIGVYLIYLGRYKAAAEHLRLSVPRSRDPRRAQFFAAVCELTLLPKVYATRGLRKAWSSLTDEQRRISMDQLRTLAAGDDELLGKVRQFIASAFAPRTYKNTRDIAREQKVRRIEARNRKAGEPASRAIAGLSAEERARLAKRLRGL